MGTIGGKVARIMALTPDINMVATTTDTVPTSAAALSILSAV